ncbi:hypothetical protein Poli38472_010894 [Pythium oligandrum]|uniref:WRKY19-like zinc finger domain-containing protein n=1 Tax=Pythium oligandrum TaxID=41045 RepID=A0A8K1FGM7_PYTOL|nr:hypothetical protein Poli38472_010894 [Pythium oligandrum]|eukprot:TMW61831.1 hypothetical protein Poli38472_010894 [Pythium oligandrum]
MAAVASVQVTAEDQAFHRHSLGFILNDGADGAEEASAAARVSTSETADQQPPQTRTVVVQSEPVPPKRSRKTKKRPLTYEEKRLARKCTVDGCLNYTINKGLCFRHGGGKKCSKEDCSASAKISGLCWKHGGSIQCVVEGCDRRGKSRGLCWAHGGGTKCNAASCTKVAVSNGFCWAHGGGKRCQFESCQRPAYERTYNYCTKHFSRIQSGDEVMEV